MQSSQLAEGVTPPASPRARSVSARARSLKRLSTSSREAAGREQPTAKSAARTSPPRLAASPRCQCKELAPQIDHLRRALNAERQARLDLEREFRTAIMHGDHALPSQPLVPLVTAIAELQRTVDAQQQQMGALSSMVAEQRTDPISASPRSNPGAEIRLLKLWNAEYETLVKPNVEQHTLDLRTALEEKGQCAEDRLHVLAAGIQEELKTDGQQHVLNLRTALEEEEQRAKNRLREVEAGIRDELTQARKAGLPDVQRMLDDSVAQLKAELPDVQGMLDEKVGQLQKRNEQWRKERQALFTKVVQLNQQVTSLVAAAAEKDVPSIQQDIVHLTQSIGALKTQQEKDVPAIQQDIVYLTQSTGALKTQQDSAAREIARVAAAQTQIVEVVEEGRNTSREIGILLRQEVHSVRDEALNAVAAVDNSLQQFVDTLAHLPLLSTESAGEGFLSSQMIGSSQPPDGTAAAASEKVDVLRTIQRQQDFDAAAAPSTTTTTPEQAS